MRTEKRQRIRFSFNGKRCEFSIPASSKTYVSDLMHRIKQLISRSLTGEPNIALDRWVAECPANIREQLCKYGLLHTTPIHTLNEILAKYKLFKPELTESTQSLLAQSVSAFNAYFGKDRDIETVSEEEVCTFRTVLPVIKLGKFNRKRSEATCAKHLYQVKILLMFAKRKRYITVNPLENISVSRRPNNDRQYFVTDEECQKILEACPTVEWRAIFAAARYVGMRCPSELQELRWSDITWSTSDTVATIRIKDQKRKRYANKRERVSPLFADAEPFFRELYEEKKPKQTDKIFPKVPTDIREAFSNIIEAAGVTRYPKPFQNLRSTRETEYHRANIRPDEYTRWIGNSPKIADDHYIQRDAVSFQESVRLFSKVKEGEEEPPPANIVPTKVPTHFVTSDYNALYEFLNNLVFYAAMALDVSICNASEDLTCGYKIREVNRIKSLLQNALHNISEKCFPQKFPQEQNCVELSEIAERLQALIDEFSSCR